MTFRFQATYRNPDGSNRYESGEYTGSATTVSAVEADVRAQRPDAFAVSAVSVRPVGQSRSRKRWGKA